MNTVIENGAVAIQGEKIVEGPAEVVQADERVIAAYLGEPFEGAPGAAEAAEVEAAEAEASETDAHSTTEGDEK